MFTRRRRWPLFPTLYKKLKDGFLSKRQSTLKKTRDSKNLKMTMPSTHSSRNILLDNRPSTSSSSFANPNKNSSVSSVDELSYDEGTGILHKCLKPTSKAFSAYKSSHNDIENAGNSSSSVSRTSSKGVTKNIAFESVCCNSIQYQDSSSSDSDELIVRFTKRTGTVNTLNEDDTEDNIGQTQESLLNLSEVNQNLNNSTNFPTQNSELDLSSENGSAYKITVNTSKRPRNLFSTSDSSNSDSDSTVRMQRFRKRKRIYSSSEESGDQNTNLSLSHRRRRRKQNALPRTNGNFESPGLRPQMSRQLRPRIKNQRKYIETDSDSSSTVEVSRHVVRGEIDEYGSNINIASSSRQDNLTESSNSDDQIKRRVCSATNKRSTVSMPERRRPSATSQQTIRSSRQLRGRNSAVLRFSSLESESEISSDTTCISPPLQSYVDSSDTDTIVVFGPRKVRGATVQINYSDSDSTTEETFPEVVNNSVLGNSEASPNLLIPPIVLDDNTSDSDAGSEKCPICFSSFGLKEVGSPESCDHSFCSECIQEWAKNHNTCPIDRSIFNTIIVRSSLNGEYVDEIPVINTSLYNDDELAIINALRDGLSEDEEELEETCCVCYSSNNSENFISCDYCDSIYHLNCLTPPLRYVPARDWFCPPCSDLEVVQNLY